MRIRRLHCLAVLLWVLVPGPPGGIGGPAQPELHLMPAPRSLVRGEGRLSLDSGFTAGLEGTGDAALRSAAVRLLERIRNKTGIPLSTAPLRNTETATLILRCGGPGEAVQSVRADESYTLEVTRRKAVLAAPAPVGILRGMETLLQLIDLDAESFFLPAVRIEDAPRFPWRGLHIDVSRHWQPADVIRRNLDAMAALKMNVLHWHLSDDQGFRVESRRFPRLHRVASEGDYYTQDEVRAVIAYGRERGIRIVPEFDMPGHTTALLVAYPELSSGPPPKEIERSWGVFDPCMDPSSDATYAFLEAFIGEMTALFPDEYFHIGGDEVNGKQWTASPKIRAFKERHNLSGNAALQAYFNRRLQKILARHGRKMIGWDETLHADLPQSVLVQSWRGHAHLARSVRQGNAAILSFGYYLDHMQPASFHYANDPLDKEAAGLTEEEKARVLGGEACMWAEFVNAENVESRIWPRAAAVAERLWSPRDVRDTEDLYRRLEIIDGDLAASGLRHRAHRERMLQRMAGSAYAGRLETLAELLQSTGLGTRVRTRKYTSLVPLNRMVDAVAPESEPARKFNAAVARALARADGGAGGFREIRATLEAWRDAAAGLRPVSARSFLLEEIAPVLDLLCDCIDTGLEAIECIQSGRRPPEEWGKRAASLLEQAQKPQAEMRIAIAPALEALIRAAGD